ncbi:unnamed protein product, partial [Durusdinium trenchii]
ELSNATKKSETKLRERAQALRNVDLYIILNPKTLQQASPEWIDKYASTTEISNLLGGYQHMLDPSDDEGSDDTAEYSLPGDEEGLR